MSSCDTYGTQCLDTGNQLQASNVAYDNTVTGGNCAHVQCYLEFVGSSLDNLNAGLSLHAGNLDNPHQSTVANLSDTAIANPIDGQVATYQNGSWVNENPVTGTTDHLLLSNIGTNSHVVIDEHIADLANPHQVTYAQLSGAVPYDSALALSAIKSVVQEVPDAQNNVIEFENVEYDGTGAYVDGVYTVPIDGRYIVSSTIIAAPLVVNSNVQEAWIRVYKNGSHVHQSNLVGNTLDNASMSNYIIVSALAGDTLKIQLEASQTAWSIKTNTGTKLQVNYIGVTI